MPADPPPGPRESHSWWWPSSVGGDTPAEPPLLARLPSETQIGPYRVLGEVGRGGMGAVYKAQDPAGNLVALKLSLADPSVKPRSVKRFQAEIQALSRLQHPHVVPVLGAGVHDGRSWLALEFVEGDSLQQELRYGHLPVDQAVQIAHQLAMALSYVHSCGLLHRDLKPDNVLLQGDRALLTDFGLARDELSSQSRLTASGALLGTPGYWSPEQARGEAKRVGPATDIYGLGAVLYACLTGHPPVQAKTLQECLTLTELGSISPPQRERPEVPLALSELCMRCLATDPADRPQTADEVARELLLAATPGREAPAPRRLRRLGVVVSLASLAGIAALLGFVDFGRRDPSQPDRAPQMPEEEPARPIPAWFEQLSPAERAPTPLPPGLHYGEQPGDYRNERDGTLLRWIPPGVLPARSGDRPQRVDFPQGFFLAKLETSWAQFRDFCRTTGHEVPSNGLDATGTGGGTFLAPDSHPVFHVTLDDAHAYCAWAGLRLPSGAEWEYAAVGPEGRRYPWGHAEPDATRLNIADQSAPWSWSEDRIRRQKLAKADFNDGFPYTAPVGSYPRGASPFGCLDLAGNVAEWVDAEDASPPPRGPGMRGGCWNLDARVCRATLHVERDPSYSSALLGFRPARSAERGPPPRSR